MSDLVERLRKQAADAIDWNGETLKRWDEIRGMVETRKGSDLPRLMFESLVENLAEHMTEAAARIEALEAALWFMLTDPPATLDEPNTDAEVVQHYREVARAALTPEQDR